MYQEDGTAYPTTVQELRAWLLGFAPETPIVLDMWDSYNDRPFEGAELSVTFTDGVVRFS